MHKLAVTIISAFGLVAASTAVANPAAPSSIAAVPPRAASPMKNASRLNDQTPVPVWALGLMGVVAAVLAAVIIFDDGPNSDTPDSN
jgi:hypothetical protein